MDAAEEPAKRVCATPTRTVLGIDLLVRCRTLPDIFDPLVTPVDVLDWATLGISRPSEVVVDQHGPLTWELLLLGPQLSWRGTPPLHPMKIQLLAENKYDENRELLSIKHPNVLCAYASELLTDWGMFRTDTDATRVDIDTSDIPLAQLFREVVRRVMLGLPPLDLATCAEQADAAKAFLVSVQTAWEANRDLVGDEHSEWTTASVITDDYSGLIAVLTALLRMFICNELLARCPAPQIRPVYPGSMFAARGCWVDNENELTLCMPSAERHASIVPDRLDSRQIDDKIQSVGTTTGMIAVVTSVPSSDPLRKAWMQMSRGERELTRDTTQLYSKQTIEHLKIMADIRRLPRNISVNRADGTTVYTDKHSLLLPTPGSTTSLRPLTGACAWPRVVSLNPFIPSDPLRNCRVHLALMHVSTERLLSLFLQETTAVHWAGFTPLVSLTTEEVTEVGHEHKLWQAAAPQLPKTASYYTTCGAFCLDVAPPNHYWPEICAQFGYDADFDEFCMSMAVEEAIVNKGRLPANTLPFATI